MESNGKEYCCLFTFPAKHRLLCCQHSVFSTNVHSTFSRPENLGEGGSSCTMDKYTYRVTQQDLELKQRISRKNLGALGFKNLEKTVNKETSRNLIG